VIGLGFAGLGRLGRSLIEALPAFPGLRLAAVQDRERALVDEVAAGQEGLWRGTDYAELLALPQVDAVVICTPNALHVPQAGAALRAGRHVLVQKPLALDPAGARATIALAEQLGRLLLVDYSYRFLETVELLSRAQPLVGPIRSVRAAFHNVHGPGRSWSFDPSQSGGGALVDLGVHLLDLVLALRRPAEVALEGRQLSFAGGHAVEDAAELVLRLGDVPCSLAVSWCAPLPATEISLELEGARGRLRWENVAGSYFRFRVRLDGAVLLDRETSLRADTLRAFDASLASIRHGWNPTHDVDARVYDLLAEAYAGTSFAAPGGAPRS
jgi:predicted dehydrogenase